MNFPTNNNPLAKHFRHPKLFIRLPSQGNFYRTGSLEKTVNNEYPVLAMTAKDELMIKTPDALLNGQSTVSVIQSCVPNIKDAWSIPSVDVDAILIAIRIATYGEKLEIETEIPNINIKRAYEVDLRRLLDQLNSVEYDNIVHVGDFKIEIAPTTYKEFTDVSLKSFEEQRIFKLLDNNELSELEKIIKFNESFSRLTDLNISVISKSIVAVQHQDDDPVADKSFISEFINNCDKEIFQAVIEHIDAQKKKFAIKPMEVNTAPEDVAAGAPEKFLVPISFDQSNFFA
jgi:hypothetical protein